MSEYAANDDLMAAAHSKEMRAEIRREWGRFDDQEIESLTDNQDLVLKLSKKYRLDHFQAQQIVEAFARGRQL